MHESGRAEGATFREEVMPGIDLARMGQIVSVP